MFRNPYKANILKFYTKNRHFSCFGGFFYGLGYFDFRGRFRPLCTVVVRTPQFSYFDHAVALNGKTKLKGGAKEQNWVISAT